LLTMIRVENLACFGQGLNQVKFAPETVIIGPNNVGKSALIAAFNFLRTNSITGTYFPPVWVSPSYNFGGFANIVHRHEVDRVITIDVELMGDNWEAHIQTMTQPDRGTSTFESTLKEQDLRRELGSIWYLSAVRGEIRASIQLGSVGLMTTWQQPINPDGSNVIPYLLERFTDQDRNWNVAIEWLKRITPEASVLKSPLRGNYASLETTLAQSQVDVNMAYQGTGMQKALSTIAALVFSPKGSTIIIEEPEIHLHPRSQEVLADLFNLVVNEWGKQVIFTTHSWDMLLPFFSDVGKGSKRGKSHVDAKPENFKLVVFDRVGEDIKIHDLDIRNMEFKDFKAYIKNLWG
jgi:predicted ATPase